MLSAVDAHTAHAIMLNCLNGDIIAGRTVLMVSHHTALVAPAASYIVALENGDVKFSGTRDEFIACGLMSELDKEDAKSPTVEKKEEQALEDKFKPGHKSIISLSQAGMSEPNSETSSIAPEDETLVSSGDSTHSDTKQKAPRKLIEDEKRATGRIAWPVWKLYLTSLGGPFWWCLFVFGVAAAMVVPVAERGWVECVFLGIPGISLIADTGPARPTPPNALTFMCLATRPLPSSACS